MSGKMFLILGRYCMEYFNWLNKQAFEVVTQGALKAFLLSFVFKLLMEYSQFRI